MVNQSQDNIKNKKNNLSSLILAGVFAAVTAICAWLTIPLPFSLVPINLALLGVHLSGALLGWRYGLYSQLIYILLGAIGVPVFSGFSGGFGIITGATGGYIIGYAVCALVVGIFAGKSTSTPRLVAGMVIGVALCYTLGTIWYVHLTQVGAWAALISCVLPFLPGDAIKILLALVLTKRLKPILQKNIS